MVSTSVPASIEGKADTTGSGGKDSIAVNDNARPEDLSKPASMPAKPKKKQGGRVTSLQGIRFFIQNWIILGHYMEHRMWDPNYTFSFDLNSNKWFAFLGRAGNGVTFYIVASGVLTYVGFRNAPLDEYFARRLIPIWVINVLGMYMTLWVVGASFWDDGFGTAAAWKTTFFLDTLRDSDMKPALNAILWTLSTLAFCWLAFPLINLAVKKTTTHQRWFLFIAFWILGGWPWIYYGSDNDWSTTAPTPGNLEGYYWDCRARPWFRVWDFAAGVVVGSWIKEGYLLNNDDYSWLWVYISDAAIIITVIVLANMSCIEEDYNPGTCREVYGFWLMEGPIGVMLWLIFIYGQFWQPEKKWGLIRRIAGHPAAVAVAAGGTTFIAYVGQGTVDAVIYGYDPEPTLTSKPAPFDFFIVFYIWVFAAIVNELVYMPVSMGLKNYFKSRKQRLAAVHAEPGPDKMLIDKSPFNEMPSKAKYATLDFQDKL